jgi:O-antigen/teichoic acid export membrane protein
VRVKHSFINISVGLMYQVIITSLSFVSRTVFINSLGINYLGVNGLFTNLLALLSLAEVGIGQSIMYSLYKPVAENDYDKINVLMKLYKKAYLVIALVILALGLSLMPFLKDIIKDSNVPNIQFIYLIFLLNTVTPYLYVHKNSFLNVCQKGYFVNGIYSISSIVSMCLKIGIISFTKNYPLYLVIDSVITIINSIIISILANKKYPFLKSKTNNKLDKTTKDSIIKNIRAIVLQNIGNYLVLGTDNIIISSFVSVIAVGLYSNYNMLIEICRTFINQVFNNIYHSIGNLVAKESKDKVYNLYKIYRLINFWLYSFFAIFLTIIIGPFIKLWLGPKFLMGSTILVILMISFYERGMRNSITTLKTTAGIFHEDRYVPLIQAIINLFFSIVLVKAIGIVGVFIGTLISALTVPFWTTPYFVYKKVFNRPLIHYFLNYVVYIIIGLGTFLLTHLICNFILVDSILKLFLVVFICIVVPNLIYTLIFYKTEEFKYLLLIIKNILVPFFLSFRKNIRLWKVG